MATVSAPPAPTVRLPLLTELRPGLTRLSLVAADAVNVYLLGDVLVDAGSRFTSRALVAALASRPPTAHALTHAHFDHQGGSAAVCRHFGIPLWCGDGDRSAAEHHRFRTVAPRQLPLAALSNRLLAGPAQPVDRTLREGDVVGGFVVLETPGHTPGHLAFWREADRVLVLGDVLFHRNPVTRRLGLREPFAPATWNRAANRAAIRRLAALGPELVCFGHGPPLADADRFREFAARLR